MAKSIIEILLWSILIVVLIFIIFVLIKNSHQSYIHGINESINESGQKNIIKIDINKSNSKITEGDLEYPTKEYDIHLSMKLENRGDEVKVIPVIKFFDSYSLCYNSEFNGENIDGPTLILSKNAKGVFECDTTAYTNHPMYMTCGTNVDGYYLCQSEMEEGSELKVGNYSIKLSKMYYAWIKRNYTGTFYIYDGGMLPKKIEISKTEIMPADPSYPPKEIKTKVYGGWVNITFPRYEDINRNNPLCVKIKTFGKPLHNIDFGNPVEVYMFPKGCAFWNSILLNPYDTNKASPEKIRNAIDYCSDPIIGYSEAKIILSNSAPISCS